MALIIGGKSSPFLLYLLKNGALTLYALLKSLGLTALPHTRII
jgi:hypothetical protein